MNPRSGRNRPYDRGMTVGEPPAAQIDLPRRLLDRTPAPLLVIGAALSVQSGAALATTLFEEAGALGAVWLRQAFGAAILIALSRGPCGVCGAGRSRPCSRLARSWPS